MGESMRTVLLIFIAFLVAGCVSSPKPKEIKMSDNQTKMCMYMSEVVYLLAEHQKSGHPKNFAIAETIKKKGKTDGDEELSLFAAKLISGRADVVYAMPELNPQSLRYFEWSMCKLRSMHGWQIDYSKMEEIRDKIIECQNMSDDQQKHQFCVEGVVYSYVK